MVVGVPLNAPVAAFSVSHDGKLPPVTANVYVPEPPLAVSAALYELFTVADGRLAGLIVRMLAAFTVDVYVWLPVSPLVLLSVAVIVKVVVPVVVGVPLRTPVAAFSASHDGKAPPVTPNV
jgi:hypothetical protein